MLFDCNCRRVNASCKSRARHQFVACDHRRAVNITITGASGFVGRRLLKTLAQSGHSLHVLSRHGGTNLPPGVRISVWDALKSPPPLDSLHDTDAVIHLAGEPVAQRWTAEVKRRIRESRVTGTRYLMEGIAKLSRKPAALICASATGFYGSRGDAPLDETSAAGSGFLAEVCVEWEHEAFAAKALGVRVAAIRTGIALDPRGGALQKMLPPFRFGVGGRLGDGKQWVPWIHLDDLIGIYVFALQSDVSGPLNATSPNPVTNADFTRALAKALHRPAIFPVPKPALKLLFGEMAEVLFESQRVAPRSTEAAGFQFRFPFIEPALLQLLG
jgi:uncharacterized protein (TIGR01777 family)